MLAAFSGEKSFFLLQGEVVQLISLHRPSFLEELGRSLLEATPVLTKTIYGIGL